MTVLALDSPIQNMLLEADASAKRHRRLTLFAIGSVAAYLGLSFIQFDVASVVRKWSPDRASMFVLDTYAHKDHITMKWSDPGNVVASFEGGYRYIYDTAPWLIRDAANGTTMVTFENGGSVVFHDTKLVMQNWPGETRDYVFRVDGQGRPFVENDSGQSTKIPEWIRVTENKIEVRPTLFERIQVYKSKVEVHRYAVGWKFFWFDFDSPLRGFGVSQLVQLMSDSNRLVPEMSNAKLVLHEFLDNEIWHHGVVLFSLVETILMALLGTMIAAMIGLPLAFLAAANITPFAALRLVLRRLFDCLRGIDMLIWSLVLLRAFGPGLFTGIFAIALTDIGTLGKLMSEAIENSDGKQKEGVLSTGASTMQQHRFGIIPQNPASV